MTWSAVVGDCSVLNPDATIGHRDEVCVVNADEAQLHYLDLLLRGDGLAPTRCFR